MESSTAPASDSPSAAETATPDQARPGPNDSCPCCSGDTLGACCGPLVARDADPETAEALMRSRYTAFTLQEVDYLIYTHHPSTVHEVNRDDLTSWSSDSTWLGLEILGGKQGGADDEDGTVEFHARYELEGQAHDHLERAKFQRHEGVWKFLDAGPLTHEPIRREEPKVGRNEPCPCGSGKKYKRCHG